MPRGWRALGHTFSLDCPDETARSSLVRLFEGLPRVTDADPVRIAQRGGGWTLEADGSAEAAGTFTEVVDALLAHLRQSAARSVDGGTALLHAAAVAFGGRVVLLPGPSGSGKSSLAFAVAQLPGWELLGDELIGLTGDGRVVPCPLPVRLGQRARQLLEQTEPTVAAKRYVAVDHAPTEDTYVLGAVVFPRFSPDVPTVLTPKAGAEAVAELSEQMFPLPPQRGLAIAADAVGRASVHDLPYGDLLKAAEQLRAAFR